MSLLTEAPAGSAHGLSDPFVGVAAAQAWVEAVARLTRPDSVVWCSGTEEERSRLTTAMVDSGSLIPLDSQLRPNSFLARSDPADVARVEDRTFICTPTRRDAGPTNNWRDPNVMRHELDSHFDGAMRGRTMYVVPFLMGPSGSPLAQVGIQITDSPYVVLSTRVMTRMGEIALDALDEGTAWTPAVHSVGAPLVSGDGRPPLDVPWPSNPHKIIAHFPQTREIWSFGSGYGGNALLAKKCFALRIASAMARDQGWLAEHMLLIKATSPDGEVRHIAAAFPSACGKTNFAMMNPTLPGWTVETLGDDIAWLSVDRMGRLIALNPEAGFFGVAPGTSATTNPSALATIGENTIFTNVAQTSDNDVWWEGLTEEPPADLTDWRGRAWSPDSSAPAAHPNGRFTAPAAQCPTIASDWEAPEGVVVDAVLFGGRRATNIPLVSEARSWDEGVFFGATIASEQTAAAEGPIGELRFDPFAMLPFCGYNMADYWSHWLSIGDRLGPGAPRVFRVNWFRKDADGAFLWPGFGDNVRVLKWVFDRLSGRVDAEVTPIGMVPKPSDLDTSNLPVDEHQIGRLLHFDPRTWDLETRRIQSFFARFGPDLPLTLGRQLARLQRNIS